MGRRRIGVGLLVQAVLLAWWLPAGWAAETSIIKVTFGCEDGTKFGATFDNEAETLALVFAVGERVLLKQGISGSGIRYEGSGYEFFGKGKSALVMRPKLPELRCEETGGSAAKPAPGDAKPQ